MILFVCSQARLRSRTAELLCLFGGLDARCCGTDVDAQYPINDNLIREADLIFCMESHHKKSIKDFQHYGNCDVLTLGVEDTYNRLEEGLIQELIYQVGFHSKEVAEAMKKGAEVLKNLPGYVDKLGTKTQTYADNDAFNVFPKFKI